MEKINLPRFDHASHKQITGTAYGSAGSLLQLTCWFPAAINVLVPCCQFTVNKNLP